MKLKRYAAAALLAVFVGSCSLLPVEEVPPTPPIIHSYEKTEYTFAPVKRGDVVESIRITMKYTPAKVQNLTFGQTGVRLDSVFVSRGDTVKAGQLLAELDLSDITAQIESNEYTAERYLLSIRELEGKYAAELRMLTESSNAADASDVSKQSDALTKQFTEQREPLELQLKMTERKLAELRSTLLERQIFAPFDGTVTYVYPLKGNTEYRSDDSTFITISDKTTSIFSTKAPEALVLQVGDTIEMAILNDTYSATIISPEQANGDESVTYAMLDTSDTALADNATGIVNYNVAERVNVLWVPSSAVKSANGLEFVYMLDESDIRYMQYVEIGLSAGGRTEIVSGLAEGDEVIVA